MTYRVELTERAERDLARLYQTIKAADSVHAAAWFNGLERAVMALDEHADRGGVVAEDHRLRQLLYGRRGRRYRVIYAIDRSAEVIAVIHIRHGARDALVPENESSR